MTPNTPHTIVSQADAENSTVARDTIPLATGETARIIAGDVWIEYTDSVPVPEPGEPITTREKHRFIIVDLVTDAVRIRISDGTPVTPDPVDYDLQEFKSKAENGVIYPAERIHADTSEPHSHVTETDI